MSPSSAARLTAACVALSLAGCQIMQRQHEEPPPPPPPPTIHEPVATHLFTIGSAEDEVVGELQVTKVMGEDTLPDIARRFNLGYEEIARANPGVDPWVPGEGREIVLPTQFVLPAAPREGLVINLAQLRVFYFPKVKEGEPQTVITHPIGIGKVGWQTPEGSTKVTGKRTNPTWFPPASVRKEHKEAGDPLPSKVPPGPDNPLGAHMMTLGWPSYLIHGTNKPYGVGLRSSHGCIRFYPEDIAELYDKIPVGTKVTVVNQPFVFGWHDGALYVQAFPVMEDDQREHPKAADTLLNAAISDEMWQKVKYHGAAVDLRTGERSRQPAARHRAAGFEAEDDGRRLRRQRSPRREPRAPGRELERQRRDVLHRRGVRGCARRNPAAEEAGTEDHEEDRHEARRCQRRRRHRLASRVRLKPDSQNPASLCCGSGFSLTSNSSSDGHTLRRSH